MMFDTAVFMRELAKLQRDRAAVKAALIGDAAKAVLLAQVDAALRSLESRIAGSASAPGAPGAAVGGSSADASGVQPDRPKGAKIGA